MSGFILQLLVKELKIPREKTLFLPRGYQRIGDILIVDIEPSISRYEKKIGRILLENVRGIKTVCVKSGPIKGVLRRPKIKIIAGNRNTETVHKENGCLYKLDVRKVMFAKGNVKERGRIAKLVQPNEVVVDFFSGIGYFSLPILKFAKPKIVYAIDKNPVAVRYLNENIKMNGFEGRIIPILGDCRKIAKRLGKIADRVIMGYLPNTFRFLPYAFEVLKEEGIIHYHDIFRKEELWNKPIEILESEAKKSGYTLSQILYKRIVKSYAPKVYHVVIDAKFSSKISHQDRF